MKPKQHKVTSGTSVSEWILPRFSKIMPKQKGGAVADIHTNVGFGRLPPKAKGKCTTDKEKKLTCYSSDFGEVIQSVKVSGLNTCAGLIIAVRPKGKNSGDFSGFIAYHWSGVLTEDVNAKEKDRAETWKKKFKEALPTIEIFLNNKGHAYGICIAGRFHPNSRSNFEAPFESMATELGFKRLDSFWTRDSEDAPDPKEIHKSRPGCKGVSLELFKKGVVIAKHE